MKQASEERGKFCQLIVRGYVESRGELKKLRSVRRIYFSHLKQTKRKANSAQRSAPSPKVL